VAAAPVGPPIGAAIDVGATSVHLLVATIGANGLIPVHDESVFLGLGRRVGEFGFLGSDARGALTESLSGYVAKARDLGASTIGVVGTEPLRRAADAATTVDETTQACGVPLHVLEHDEEAYLTIIGVMAEKPVKNETLIVDVGGGSTELCLLHPGVPPQVIGLRLGAATLTDRYLAHDPPTDDEIRALDTAARDGLLVAPRCTPTSVIAVGGTASNLLKLTQDVSEGSDLTPARLNSAVERLRSQSSAAVVQGRAINPKRAPLLAAGAAIIGAVLDRYGLSQMSVSEAGIRDGLILAMRHGGISWRDRLGALVEGRAPEN
jgi:exopolyphosphatase/guanosine-5'-triphosphate,3'-diphosphate pyrophosphatase